MGRGEKYLEIGERFFDRRPLFLLPIISREHACVKNELVVVINHMFVGIRQGSLIGVRYCVVDLPQDNLDGVGGSIRLVEVLVVSEPVRVRNHGIRLIQVGDQIQRTGSAVSQVLPVQYTKEVVFDGAQKLLEEGVVHVLEVFERNCRRVVVLSK